MNFITDSISQVDTFLFFSGKFLNEPEKILLFFSKNPNVSKYNNEDDFFINYDFNYDTINQTYNFYMDKYYGVIDERFAKWGSGNKIYVVAYPFVAYEIDMRNGAIRWLGLGEPSNIVEFIIP